MTRFFLAASALLWLPYGLLCFVDPARLAEVAGVASTSPTGQTELRAMYGGLQSALGVLAAVALFRPSLQRPALVTLLFVCAGLFTARLLGAVMSQGFSSYTLAGLAFELASSGIAAWLLPRLPQGAPA